MVRFCSAALVGFAVWSMNLQSGAEPLSSTNVLVQVAPLKAQTPDARRHRFDEVYFTLSHNTYRDGDGPSKWFQNGVRAAELDILDVGPWQKTDAGPVVRHGPGGGYDGKKLGDYLRECKSWLETNHGPLLLFIDFKTSLNPPGDWSGKEIARIDELLAEWLGDTLYSGDLLYQDVAGVPFGSGSVTFRQAVSQRGWPVLDHLKHKVVVAYTGGVLGGANQTQERGLQAIMAQKPNHLPNGFFCPDVDNLSELLPGGRVQGMSSNSSQCVIGGNLKAADHYQIIANTAAQHHQILHLWGKHVYEEDSFTYNYIAVAHGVSAIGRENVAGTFGDAIPVVGVRRSLPGYFRLQPTAQPSLTVEIAGGGVTDGTPARLAPPADKPYQQFVYTAEGQLRPKHQNTKGIDIKGGQAGEGRPTHLWDCSGGKSEKWLISPEGVFLSFSDPRFALGIQAQSLVVTSATDHDSGFSLVPVKDWEQRDF